VGDSDNPHVGRTVDVEDGKRKVFEPETFDAWNLSIRWVTFRSRRDSSECLGHVPLETCRKGITATVTIKRNRVLQLGLGINVKSERFALAWHLHFLQRPERFDSLRCAVINLFEPAANFFLVGGIQSFRLRAGVDSGDEALVKRNQFHS